jgi:hypothetical protein
MARAKSMQRHCERLSAILHPDWHHFSDGCPKVLLLRYRRKADLDLSAHILFTPDIKLATNAIGLHYAVDDSQSQACACLKWILLGKGMKELILAWYDHERHNKQSFEITVPLRILGLFPMCRH